MSKHTPGPWRWIKKQSCMDGYFLVSGGYDDLRYWAGESDTGLVLDSDPSDGEYRPAIDPDSPDGRLIAAAPEMLAVLEQLRDHKPVKWATIHELVNRARGEP